MKLHWQIESDDAAKVLSFLKSWEGDTFVKNRIARNLSAEKSPVTKVEVWYWLVGCLLTTQQRSGPKSAVSRFQDTKPFPLRYEKCLEQGDRLGDFVIRTLTDFGGLRRSGKIADELTLNLRYLEGGGWDQLLAILERLRSNPTIELEREAADFIDDYLKGFGPKQSRNLIQCIGLSRYEIPIDSRITKWLNDFGFPLRLSAAALSDRNYYRLISDGFQHLCKECGVLPCVLDAAIFASFDNGDWNDEPIPV